MDRYTLNPFEHCAPSLSLSLSLCFFFESTTTPIASECISLNSLFFFFRDDFYRSCISFFFLFSDSKLISLQLGVRFEQLDGVIKALSIEGEKGKKFLFDRCATGFYLSIRSNNSTGRGGEGYECSLKILLLHGYYVSLPCLYSDARLACSVERGSTVIAVLSGTHSRYISLARSLLARSFCSNSVNLCNLKNIEITHLTVLNHSLRKIVCILFF